RAEGAEAQAQARLWVSYLEQAQLSRMSRQPGQRFAGLRAVREALKLPVPEGHSIDELRAAAIGCLALPDLELAAEFELPPEAEPTITVFDPTLTHVARADARGAVTVYRLADRAVTARLPGEGRLYDWGLAFSPDGRLVPQLFGADGQLRIWRLGAGPAAPQLVYRGHTGCGSEAAFSPDGLLLAHPDPEGGVRLVDTRTGQLVRKFPTSFGIRGVNFHPTRPWLTVLSSERQVKILDMNTGAVVAAPARIPRVNNWAWHPAGRYLAFTTEWTWMSLSDELIHLYDVGADRPVRPPLKGPTNVGIGLAFNHSGDRLLTHDWSGLARLWHVEPGQHQRVMPDPILVFGPDDRFLGSPSVPGRPRLYRFAPGRELRTFRAPEAGVKYCYSAVCCGGRLLAVGSKSEFAF